MKAWTNVEDLIAILNKRWKSGRFLQNYAQGLAWVPIELSVKSPSADELLKRFNEATVWAERFQRDSHTKAGIARFSVDYRMIKGRNFGSNSVPVRIRIESLDQLCTLLNTTPQLNQLDQIIDKTRNTLAELVPWVRTYPLKALDNADIWNHLLAIVSWIKETNTEHLYLRQIDVEGVDTKFIDHHKKILDELLLVVLSEEQIDRRYSTSDFVRRYRFRSKPNYTRFRLLEPELALPKGCSEFMLRTEELASLELNARLLFVVENEITYLAFPHVPNAIVIFGSGFGLASLHPLPWLDGKQIIYWGDIDTHGFAILNKLRSRFNSVRSILMDEATLLAHQGQWVTEPSPTNRLLPNLTEAEATLYNDLNKDRFGPRIRLEQERVRPSLLAQQLASL